MYVGISQKGSFQYCICPNSSKLTRRSSGNPIKLNVGRSNLQVTENRYKQIHNRIEPLYLRLIWFNSERIFFLLLLFCKTWVPKFDLTYYGSFPGPETCMGWSKDEKEVLEKSHESSFLHIKVWVFQDTQGVSRFSSLQSVRWTGDSDLLSEVVKFS